VKSPSLIVRFSDVREFVEEMAAYPPNVQDCVRYTAMFRMGVGAIRTAYAVATYLRDDGPVMIVELMQYAGDVWASPGMGDQEPNKSTAARLTEIQRRVTEAARLQALNLAAGMYTAEQFDRLQKDG
jgi:hypothetical protein